MILTHLGKRPEIAAGAYVAPDATICGDVRIADGARIMHGARIVAEGGGIEIGPNTIVMQNAVVRATAAHDCRIGADVLIGPTAHVVGATIEERVFLATGTSIFHASRIGRGSVVRINGVVHVNSVLKPESTVPIGWIAVGDPAEIFSPDRHDDIWAVQEPLKFVKTAYGIDEPLIECMDKVTAAVSRRLAAHDLDTVVDRQIP